MTIQHQKLEHAHENPDTWHRHTPDEGHGQPEHGSHASPKVLLITLVAMVFGTLFVVLVLMAFFNSYTSAYKAAVEETTSIGNVAREARTRAQGELESWGWVDHDTVRVPIERAMEQVVRERGDRG